MVGFFKSFFGADAGAPEEEEEEDHFDQGMTGWKDGNYKEAIANFDEVISKDHGNAEAYFNRANAKVKVGLMEEAIKDYDRAIDLDPNSAKAYSNRGVIKEKLGRLAEAATDYGEAIRLKPNLSVTYNNRGKTRFKLDHYEEAVADYNKAIKLNPKYGNAYYNRARSKQKLGKKEEAMKDFDEAIRFEPKNARAYYFRGAEKLAKGWNKDAIADFDAAIRINPKNAMAFFNQGTAKNKLGQKEEALKDFDAGLRLNRKNTRALFNRGNIRFSLKKYREALEDYGKAVKYDPNFGLAYYGRGTAKLALNSRKSGIKDLEIFVQLTENSFAESSNIREEAIKYLESLKKPASANTSQAIKQPPATPDTSQLSLEANEPGKDKKPDIKEIKFEAILFIDICDSTPIIDSYGELHFNKILAALNGPLKHGMKKYDCLYDKSTGDGYMLCFDKCTDAVNIAIMLFQEMEKYNQSTPNNLKCDMRIGIDCGQVHVREDNLDRVGDAANVSKRIEGLTESSFVELSEEVGDGLPKLNRIFVSAKVLTMVGEREEYKLRTVGWAELKGKIGVRYQIFEILWKESTPVTKPTESTIFKV